MTVGPGRISLVRVATGFRMFRRVKPGVVRDTRLRL